MRALVLGAGVAVVLALGCAEDSANGNDAVQSVDGRSAVDTLMALVSLRAGPDAGYLDHRHLRRLRLRIDDRPWGTFQIEAHQPLDEGSGWVVSDTHSEALVIAELGRELERTDEPLDTISEWQALLEKHLAPGDHVAEIEQIWLEAGDGQSLQSEPRLLIPFSIVQGDATAYLGDPSIDVELGRSR